MKQKIILALASLALSIISCSDFPEPYTPPRIIPGVSVDGVKLGDSKERVEELLGKPDKIGWADGTNRAWRLYGYLRNQQYSLSVYFLEVNYSDYGPVDAFMMHEAYDGKTREGIGDGSSREEVLRLWGNPQKTFPRSEGPSDMYCFNRKTFGIYYSGSLISSMYMVYFIPIPGDTVTPCH